MEDIEDMFKGDATMDTKRPVRNLVKKSKLKNAVIQSCCDGWR